MNKVIYGWISAIHLSYKDTTPTCVLVKVLHSLAERSSLSIHVHVHPFYYTDSDSQINLYIY